MCPHLSHVGAVRAGGQLDQGASLRQAAGDQSLLVRAGELEQELDHATPDLVQRERDEVIQDHLGELLQLGGWQDGDQLLDNVAGF